MSPAIALEQPGIRRLLGQLLERLERNPTRDRVPMQKLDEAHMPEFGPNRRAGDAEAAWAALKALEAAGFLSIDPIKPKLGKADYEQGPRVRLVVDEEEALRVLAGIPRKGPGPAQLWRDALVRAFGAGDSRLERLAAYRMPFIEGRTMDDFAQGLRRLGAEPGAVEQPLRTLSARFFWGDSKVLDGRGDLLAALFAPGREILEMRVHLPIWIGSDDFSEILIVENQDTFDLVCRVSVSRRPAPVVLCAHGFKASASRIRSARGCLPLYATSSASAAGKARFEAWLFRASVEGLPTAFWGDLDWEGMRILKALRDSFQDTQCWIPGYAPMLKQLESGDGHTAAHAGKEGQRRIEKTGCLFADSNLIPALRKSGRFLDQEYVSENELREQLRD